MIQKLLFDWETSGVNARDDDGLEFGYFRIDENLNIVKGGVLYFYKDTFNVESSAQAVHGLTRAFLSQHSHLMTENLAKMYSLMHNIPCIGKNIQFDYNFSFQMACKYGSHLAVPQPSELIELQAIYGPVFKKESGTGRIGTLEEWVKHLGITQLEIFKIVQPYTQEGRRNALHSALYDCAAYLLILRKLRERGIVI